jgi:hypothetical protein
MMIGEAELISKSSYCRARPRANSTRHPSPPHDGPTRKVEILMTMTMMMMTMMTMMMMMIQFRNSERYPFDTVDPTSYILNIGFYY